MDYQARPMSLQDIVNSAINNVKTASASSEVALHKTASEECSCGTCAECKKKKMSKKEDETSKTSSANIDSLLGAIDYMTDELLKTAEALEGHGAHPGTGPGALNVVDSSNMRDGQAITDLGKAKHQIPAPTLQKREPVETTPSAVSTDNGLDLGGKPSFAMTGKQASDMAVKMITETEGGIPAIAIKLAAASKTAAAPATVIDPALQPGLIDHLKNALGAAHNAVKPGVDVIKGEGEALLKHLGDSARKGMHEAAGGRMEAAAGNATNNAIDGGVAAAERLVQGVKDIAKGNQAPASAPAEAASLLSHPLALPIGIGGGVVGGAMLAGGGGHRHGEEHVASDNNIGAAIKKIAEERAKKANAAGGDGNPASISAGNHSNPLVLTTTGQPAPGPTPPHGGAGKEDGKNRVTPAEAKKPQKEDLKAYLTEPALSPSTDPSLSHLLTHTRESGAKIANAGTLAGARNLLERLQAEVKS